MKVNVLVTQSRPALLNPMDYSPPGIPIHGILQGRILEWVSMPSSRGYFWPRVWTWVSYITDGFFIIWVTKEAQYNKNYHQSLSLWLLMIRHSLKYFCVTVYNDFFFCWMNVVHHIFSFFSYNNCFFICWCGNSSFWF